MLLSGLLTGRTSVNAPKEIKYKSDIWPSFGQFEQHKEEVRPAIAEQVAALNNQDLLSHYTHFAGGDDYDGCWTCEGCVVWEELSKEFNKRLVDCGFLDMETSDARA